ncbi:MAG: 3-oxoacyl-[acyl-carrier protein] reductase, partial [Candidatus Omnitrophota bacterium]
MKKTALVTGGLRGIGLGISQALAREGYNLAVNGIRAEEAVQDALAILRETGVDVLYCPGDVAEAEARERIFQQVRTHFGQLNVLVNNAGVAPRQRKDLLETDEADYAWLMDINLTGPHFLMQAAANWMIEQRAADPDRACCLINVGSISASVVSVNRAEYCISKAGMAMSTQLFACRLGAFGIPVYEIQPGLTESDMTKVVKGKYDALIEAGICVQPRWGTPEDCGKAVAMLCRGDLPYSTGQVIMID